MLNLNTLLSKKQLKSYKNGELSDSELTSIIKTKKSIDIDLVKERNILRNDISNYILELLNTATVTESIKADVINTIKADIERYLTNDYNELYVIDAGCDVERFASMYDYPHPDQTIQSLLDTLYITSDDGDDTINALTYDMTINIINSLEHINLLVSRKFHDTLIQDVDVFEVIDYMSVKNDVFIKYIESIELDIDELFKLSVSEYCEQCDNHVMLNYLDICEIITGIKQDVLDLFNDIKRITGEKTLTLTSDSFQEKIEIDEDNTFGDYDLGDLYTLFVMCFMNGAGMVIRQRTGDIITVNDKELHKVNIYGCSIFNDKYKWNTEEEMFEAYYTDSKTGDILEIHPDVNCCGYYFN